MINSLSEEVQLLAHAASFIRNEFIDSEDKWEDSPFKWIVKLPSASKGKIGKRLVAQWCALKDFTINKSPDSEADILINGHRFEIKFSTLWKSGIYAFQQIRDQNYEYCICLGISPFDAHCWIISKKTLLENVIGHMGQHTGVDASETSWLRINPSNLPDWLKLCGGTLNSAFEILAKIKRT